MIFIYMAFGAVLLWFTILCIGSAMGNYQESRIKADLKADLIRNGLVLGDSWNR